MLERIEVRNHSMAPRRMTLQLQLDADFADVQEIGRPGRRLRSSTRRITSGGRTLTIVYRARSRDLRLHRGVRVRVIASGSTPTWRGRTLRFALDLAPRSSWRATIEVAVQADGRWRAPLPPRDPMAETARDRARKRWERSRFRVHAA